MSIITISHILDAHGVPYTTSGDRIYADDMIVGHDVLGTVIDVTSWTKSQLYDWLGY